MGMLEERLRRDLEHIALPADPSGVMERVLRRAGRRRLIRRVQVAGLAVVVVTGTIAGTYGLSRVFRPGHGKLVLGTGTVAPSPADASAPSVVPSTLSVAGKSLLVCGVSSVQGDYFADGKLDTAYVFVPTSRGLAGCPEPGHGLTFIGLQPNSRGDVSIIDGPIDCPSGCRAFAAADIDGDGRAELAVVTGQSGSTEVLTLYRVVDHGGSGSGGASIEQIQISAPEVSLPSTQAASGSSYSPAAGGSCDASGARPELSVGTAPANGSQAGYDVAFERYLADRYRQWLDREDHAYGVRAGQDPALLSRLARAAAEQGLDRNLIESIYKPSFSWGLNDPYGGGRLLRFLLGDPDLIPGVLSFQSSFRPDTSDPYFGMNPGAAYQAALLEKFPQLHAAYSVMAEGRHPFADFWTTEGNLLPLASIAGQDDKLGREAANVLRALQRGLRQFPDRNYFFKGGEYAGPSSIVSLRPDLAAFVRNWEETQQQDPDPCSQPI